MGIGRILLETARGSVKERILSPAEVREIAESLEPVIRRIELQREYEFWRECLQQGNGGAR